MTQLPTAHEIARKGHWETATDTVTLSYEDRFLRRKVLTAGSGAGFLVDLAHTESLDHGDAFRLTDGRLVEVVAAEEPLLAVSGADLPRIPGRMCVDAKAPPKLFSGPLLALMG